MALAACTMSTEASEGSPAEPVDDAVEAPLPTIGLGSAGGDLEVSTGGTTVDGEAVESITMIGDSITVASTEALQQQFGQLGFDDVTIVAEQGKRIGESFGDNTSGVSIASYLAGEDDGDPSESLWIVALGTNDISQYDESDELEAVVDSIMDAVPAEAPMIWVDTYIEQHPQDTATVNAAISSAVAERGNATVGNWSTYASDDGVLSQDGVHPTDEGELTFADVVASTAANFLQR